MFALCVFVLRPSRCRTTELRYAVLSLRSVSRYLREFQGRGDPGKRRLAFLRNHRKAIVELDFFTVPTLSFRVWYCLFVMPTEDGCSSIVLSSRHLETAKTLHGPDSFVTTPAAEGVKWRKSLECRPGAISGKWFCFCSRRHPVFCGSSRHRSQGRIRFWRHIAILRARPFSFAAARRSLAPCQHRRQARHSIANGIRSGPEVFGNLLDLDLAASNNSVLDRFWQEARHRVGAVLV